MVVYVFQFQCKDRGKHFLHMYMCQEQHANITLGYIICNYVIIHLRLVGRLIHRNNTHFATLVSTKDQQSQQILLFDAARLNHTSIHISIILDNINGKKNITTNSGYQLDHGNLTMNSAIMER